MKVGIDVRAACGKKAGKGWYTFHIVKELLKQDRKNEYVLYTNTVTADLAAFGNAQIKVINKKSLFWHFAVIKDFKMRGGEIFFAPTSFIIPAFLPQKITSIITVHDLVSFLHPNLHQAKATILEHLFFRMALKKTAHVLVPSNNTKNDLMKMFRCPENKITVTPLGVSEKFFKIPENLKKVKEKYNLPEKFILTVSGLEPRKNISALIEAVSRIKNLGDTKLVIVGGKGWKSEKLQCKIAGLKNLIHHIPSCEDDELAAFYHLAEIFVYPSLYEGFGLPPLEAMASGCPVICSNTSSLPEVCGSAALMFNPNNVVPLGRDVNGLASPRLGLMDAPTSGGINCLGRPCFGTAPALRLGRPCLRRHPPELATPQRRGGPIDELKSAIEKLHENEKLRAELKEKGILWAKEFTWQKTAEKTLKILSKERLYN